MSGEQTERERLAQIIVQHFGYGSNDAIEFGPNSGVLIKPRTIADRIIAAGYVRASATTDDREVAMMLLDKIAERMLATNADATVIADVAAALAQSRAAATITATADDREVARAIAKQIAESEDGGISFRLFMIIEDAITAALAGKVKP